MPKKKKDDVIHQPTFHCSCGSTFNDEVDLKYHKESGQHNAFIKELLTVHFD